MILMGADGNSEVPEWFVTVLDMSRSTLRTYFQRGLPDSLMDIILKDMTETREAGSSIEDLVILFEEKIGVYKARGIDRWNYKPTE